MKNQKPIGRRDFVKMLGVGTGAMMINPTLGLDSMDTLSHLTSDVPSTLKIGLLLPSSTIRPGMTTSLMNGLQLYFDQARAAQLIGHVQLIPQPIGLGSTVAMRKATHLLNEAHVDLVIGMVSADTAMRMRPIFEAKQRFLVVASAGESILHEHEYSPLIYHSTLNYWQANFRMGQWAAAHLGSRVFMASSFYESGFDSLYAFQRGFEQAGGMVVGTATTHRLPDNDEVGGTLAAIEASQSDVVFAAYSGKDAHHFMHQYAATSLAGRAPLIGTPFMYSDSEIAPVDFYYGAAWLPELDTAPNVDFVTRYRRTIGHTPDAFAVLGYDTAQLLVQAIQNAGLKNLVDGLANARFEGPRGQMDMTKQLVHSPIVIARAATHQPLSASHIEAHLPLVAVAVTDKHPVRTGWLNPYLV